SFYWDHARAFAGHLVQYLKRPTLPLLETTEHVPLFREGMELFGHIGTLSSIFDRTDLKTSTAVELWNAAADEIDGLPRRPSDDTYLVRVFHRDAADDKVCPDGITLSGMLESAAYCMEFGAVAGMPIDDVTKGRLLAPPPDRQYRQLIDYLSQNMPI